jgi:hypothetical protein
MCPANEHDSPVVVDAIESESDLQSGGCQKVVKMQPDRHGSEEGLAGVEAPRMPYVWSPLCNAADLATLQRRASRLSNMIRKWPSRKAVFHQLPLRACQSQSRVPAPRVRLVSSCMVCAHSNLSWTPTDASMFVSLQNREKKVTDLYQQRASIKLLLLHTSA